MPAPGPDFAGPDLEMATEIAWAGSCDYPPPDFAEHVEFIWRVSPRTRYQPRWVRCCVGATRALQESENACCEPVRDAWREMALIWAKAGTREQEARYPQNRRPSDGR